MTTKTTDALPPFDEDILYDAQELAFDAWEESNRQKRVALAKKALKLSPYCIDAYNILAEDTEDSTKCVELYTQGIEAGKKAFGKKFFRENQGYFWGLIETRPYMRAMEGLADCLWELGDHQKAIETYLEMLRLNPNDNQGVRYILLGWLITESVFEPAEKLLLDYKDDSSAFLLYGAALLYFKQGRKVKARNALKKAMDVNSYIPEFLLNPKKKYIPKSEAERMFGGYQKGHPSEAEEYRRWANKVWKETPDALEWLKECL
jgi:tetratricopeptide (TPR) repeat protein